MKNLVFILLFAMSATLYGQTENPFDTIKPLGKGTNIRSNEKLDQYLDFDAKEAKSSLSNSKAALYEPLYDKERLKNVDLNLPPLDIYVGPPLENNTLTRNPFANDYSFYSGMGISDQLWLTSSSIQNTYPTLGAIRSVNLHLNYQPADWLIISGGPFGSKYELLGRSFNHNPGGNSFNDVGASGNLKFILHDRIRLNGFGQYSVYGKKNKVEGPMMGMYPQTYYGGSIELKITQKFGVEGGVIRELNPFNGKWVNRPFIAPVIYAK